MSHVHNITNQIADTMNSARDSAPDAFAFMIELETAPSDAMSLNVASKAAKHLSGHDAVLFAVYMSKKAAQTMALGHKKDICVSAIH